MSWPNYRAYVKIDPNRPQAAGICDRCGIRYPLRDLVWQYEWRGARLTNLKWLVCPVCLDVPDEHLRPIVLPADPVPVRDPRPMYPNPPVNGAWDRPNSFWNGTYGARPYAWDQATIPTNFDSPYPVPEVLGHAQTDSWDGMTIPEDTWGEWH